MVAHPDQTDLSVGQLRVAVSLRQIGEGHLSSIGFATAVLGPGRRLTVADRSGRRAGRAMALRLAWGALFGVAFAAAGYALTGRRRDFTSRSATVPSRFEVLVAAGYGNRARTALEGAAR